MKRIEKNGFSLVEVMIIFVVMAVLLAASMPLLSRKSHISITSMANMNHGGYVCYPNPNGEGFIEEYYKGRRLKTTQTVPVCKFKPPGNVATFNVTAIGAGAGGYNSFNIQDSQHTITTSFSFVNGTQENNGIISNNNANTEAEQKVINDIINQIMQPQLLWSLFTDNRLNYNSVTVSAYTGKGGTGGSIMGCFSAQDDGNCSIRVNGSQDPHVYVKSDNDDCNSIQEGKTWTDYQNKCGVITSQASSFQKFADLYDLSYDPNDYAKNKEIIDKIGKKLKKENGEYDPKFWLLAPDKQIGKTFRVTDLLNNVDRNYTGNNHNINPCVACTCPYKYDIVGQQGTEAFLSKTSFVSKSRNEAPTTIADLFNSIRGRIQIGRQRCGAIGNDNSCNEPEAIQYGPNIRVPDGQNCPSSESALRYFEGQQKNPNNATIVDNDGRSCHLIITKGTSFTLTKANEQTGEVERRYYRNCKNNECDSTAQQHIAGSGFTPEFRAVIKMWDNHGSDAEYTYRKLPAGGSGAQARRAVIDVDGMRNVPTYTAADGRDYESDDNRAAQAKEPIKLGGGKEEHVQITNTDATSYPAFSLEQTLIRRNYLLGDSGNHGNNVTRRVSASALKGNCTIEIGRATDAYSNANHTILTAGSTSIVCTDKEDNNARLLNISALGGSESKQTINEMHVFNINDVDASSYTTNNNIKKYNMPESLSIINNWRAQLAPHSFGKAGDGSQYTDRCVKPQDLLRDYNTFLYRENAAGDIIQGSRIDFRNFIQPSENGTYIYTNQKNQSFLVGFDGNAGACTTMGTGVSRDNEQATDTYRFSPAKRGEDGAIIILW